MVVGRASASRRWFFGLILVVAAWGAWRYGLTHPALVRRIVSPGPLSAAHAFLDTNCTACHTPGRGVQRTSCVGCHANDAQLLGRAPTAFHATIAACAGCHAEHDAVRRRPIAMDHILLAAVGSTPTRDRTHASVDTSPARQAVENPDSAHSAPAPLRDGLPFPLLRRGEERLDCASCHSSKDPHRKLFGSDCATCHATSAWTIPGYLHPSPRSVNCVQCHQAPPSHFMMHFEMVSKAVARRPNVSVGQCYACHQTTAWNDIVGVGWYKHH